MIGCLLTTLNTLEITTNPPSRLLARDTEGGPAESRPPLRSYVRWAVPGRSPPGYAPVRRLPPHPPGGRSCRLLPPASFRPTPARRPSTRTPPGTSPDPHRRRHPARRGETPPGRRLLADAWRSPPFLAVRRARCAG